MSSDEKIQGPASYFPAIEKKYGQPIAHWMAVLQQLGPLKHMELVSHLKAGHGFGHGHANALVAAFMSGKRWGNGLACPTHTISRSTP